MRRIEVTIGNDADVSLFENGNELEDSETVFVTRMVKLREIKKMLLEDERIFESEILLENIYRIAANFLFNRKS